MTNQEKRPTGTHNPSKKISKKALLERHQMDIQRILSISLAATNNLIEGLNLCLEASLQISGMDCGGIYLFDDTFFETIQDCSMDCRERKCTLCFDLMRNIKNISHKQKRLARRTQGKANITTWFTDKHWQARQNIL